MSPGEFKPKVLQFEGVAPHVEIVWQANRFEFAGNDEIEHGASINAEHGSGIRPAQERDAGSHGENLFDGLPVGRLRCRQ